MAELDAPCAVRRSSAQRHRARLRARWFFKGVRCAVGPPGLCKDESRSASESQLLVEPSVESLTVETDDGFEDICEFVLAIRQQRQEQSEATSRSLVSHYRGAGATLVSGALEDSLADPETTAEVKADECTIKEVERLKEAGNSSMLQGDAEGAVRSYSEGLRVLQSGSELPVELHSVLHSNRAFANIALQQWMPVISDCDEALRIKPANMKAYYRRAFALYQLGQMEAAFSDVCTFVGNQPVESCHADAIGLLSKICEQMDVG